MSRTGAGAVLPETPGQTAGPYVHIGCVPSVAGLSGLAKRDDPGATMIAGVALGERIALTGAVHDGSGAPLTDAIVELWQADANGRFAGDPTADPHFRGWGRAAADLETGAYRFDTVRPGPVPWPDGRMQAPHMTLWIVARGINMGLLTRVYFEGDAANAADPLLSAVPSDRAATLMARHDDGLWRFDVHLQGVRETVFLDI